MQIYAEQTDWDLYNLAMMKLVIFENGTDVQTSYIKMLLIEEETKQTIQFHTSSLKRKQINNTTTNSNKLYVILFLL